MDSSQTRFAGVVLSNAKFKTYRDFTLLVHRLTTIGHHFPMGIKLRKRVGFPCPRSYMPLGAKLTPVRAMLQRRNAMSDVSIRPDAHSERLRARMVLLATSLGVLL